ncbi:group III truncated hemoglobin [Aquimarina pacifica]|uniref:group III truncated hemoglobin n=1 Tax=Aquimarina pacifica TaxID=1296415 RepID=UPI00046FE2DE|nr:group III truncated hemoglobin [Aquimarina pacifica]
MKDITSRKDIAFLMSDFYNKAIAHPEIGVFFTDIARIDLIKHLPEITDFWEQQLFRKGGYKKNVLQIHKDLDLKKKLKKVHFETWLSLFNKSVDDFFIGEKAELIKTRALSISIMMRSKID